MRPLYATLVEIARAPHWYKAGGVPDTIDGRFDMIMLATSLVGLRLEALGLEGGDALARLTEVLVEDMEGQVREIGFGDLVVGKHVGQMMSALGGRLGAYRAALAGGDLEVALVRNLYRGEDPAAPALAHVAGKVRDLVALLTGLSLDELRAGVISR